jgi:hypothetical protein
MKKHNHYFLNCLTGIIILLSLSCQQNPVVTKEDFLKDLKKRTFNFFWENKDPTTCQIPDRFPTRQFTSTAATGFGLASYIIGIENKYISRAEGAEQVEKTLTWLWNSRQGPESSGTTGYMGFYYHFLTYDDGVRFKNVELSTIDTGWLLSGILACQSYFTGEVPEEQRIRALADSIFLRVEWDWAMDGKETMSMGWHPETGLIKASWQGYNEAMMIIILALGSPTHPVHDSAWNSWCKTYQWREYMGMEFVNFGPLFGHQYSQMFIDFRGIYDPYMAKKGIDYFENSRRATLSNRQYCITNPGKFEGYSSTIWGLTACDGPADVKEADTLRYRTYWARGAGALGIADDGTIAPTASGGSVPFAPEECIDALFTMKNTFGDNLYQEYGFKDSFNMTFTPSGKKQKGWFDPDYLGIDQGPILIQLENYQTDLIWKIMKQNKYIINGLKKAGFTGGWLDGPTTAPG